MDGEMRFRVSPLTGLDDFFWRAQGARGNERALEAFFSKQHFVGFVKVMRVLFYTLKWPREKKKGGREESLGIKYKCRWSRADNIGEGLCFRKSAL